MKKTVLFLICILPILSMAQTARIDLSNQNSSCQSELIKLDVELENLLNTINELTVKGDSVNMKRALDIVNNSFKSKIKEYKKLQDECLKGITSKVNLDLEVINNIISDLEKRVEEKNSQLADCNLKNNNEVANSLLKELKVLFKNVEQKQILIDKQIAEIKRLKEDSVIVMKSYGEIKNDTIVLNKQIFSLKKDIEKKDAVIDVFKDKSSLFSIGLAFGPNFDNKGDYIYLVNGDSTIQEKQVGQGANGMVSAVVSFQFELPFMVKASQKAFKWNETSKKNIVLPGSYKFLLNVPLTETLFQDKENAIGIFNKKMALGFGFGIDILRLANGKQSLSAFYIVNFSPVTRLDTEYYSDYNFTEGYPNKIDLNNYVTYNEVNTTHFVGLYLSLF